MTYAHRQYGKVLLAFAAVFLLGLTGWLVFAGELLPALIVSAFTVLLLACFSWLTVEVHAQSVRLSFGLGWIKKDIPLDTVESTEIVQTKWWWGWGIRLTPDGWMWNISGFDAVRLHKTDGRSFTIGTDDAKKLKGAIDRMIGKARDKKNDPPSE